MAVMLKVSAMTTRMPKKRRQRAVCWLDEASDDEVAYEGLGQRSEEGT